MKGRQLLRFDQITLLSTLILATLLFCAFFTFRGAAAKSSLATLSASVSAQSSAIGGDFVQRQRRLAATVGRFGTAVEAELFENLSKGLLAATSSTLERTVPGQVPSGFSAFQLWFYRALLQSGFGVVISYRLILFLLIIGAAVGVLNLRQYTGDDLLGQTGTDRVFYSGIHLGLGETTASGVPVKQVVGLACPQMVPLTAARASAIGKVLEQFGAANETNLTLAAIVEKHSELPGYVVRGDEEALLKSRFGFSSLRSVTAVLLGQSLAAYKELKFGSAEQPRLDGAGPEQLGSSSPIAVDESGRLTLEQFGGLYRHALLRVLTPALKEELVEYSASEIATLVLAHQAAKVLVYGREGSERWVLKSSFPELSARAVLHSIPAFAKEYGLESRTLIRRALVFATRKSVFAPVMAPRDFTDRERSLRQWSEITMAPPHEMLSRAEDVELVAYLHEAHQEWCNTICGGKIVLNSRYHQEVYSTQGNLLFVPLELIVELMREIVSPAVRIRLRELIGRVSQRQRLQLLSAEHRGDGELRTQAVMDHERIIAPFSAHEAESVAKAYGLNGDAVNEWSAYRVILDSHSWLGKRVGDYSIPPGATVFAVLDLYSDDSGRSQRISRAGMVALRATRLEEQWGKNWRSRFTQARKVIVTENRETFELLKSGAELPSDDLDETAG